MLGGNEMSNTLTPLEGKTALVTGGTAGIGLACAGALLAAGVTGLVINGRSSERAEQARSGLATRHPAARIYVALGDIIDPGAAQHVAQTAEERLARIDIVLNTSGGNDVPKLLHETPIEDIPGILQRSASGQILMSRAVLPGMMRAGGGVILNIASDAAKVPTPGETVIGAAMAAIVMFTRALAVEGKRRGVRANVLTPSIVRGTAFYDRLMLDPFAGKIFRKAEALAHLGVAEKEDLAAAVVFLASPQAAKITGQALSITGGISAL